MTDKNEMPELKPCTANEKAIDVLDDVLSWGDTPDHILRSANEALTALRGIEAVDVDGVYRDLIKKFDEYKNGDSSRPASFYEDRKPTLLWAVEYLAANGYRIYKMGEKK